MPHRLVITLATGEEVLREPGEYHEQAPTDPRADPAAAGPDFEVAPDGSLVVTEGAAGEAFAPGTWRHVRREFFRAALPRSGGGLGLGRDGLGVGSGAR